MGRLTARFAAGLFLATVASTPATADPPKAVDFAHEVVPILKAHCAKCHTNGTYKGSMSLDTRADALKKAAVPGKSAQSEMIKRVTSQDADERMPPEGKRLSDKEVQTLRAWIDEGLAWEPGFSFKARTYVAPLNLRRPGVPGASRGSNHPIDRILSTYFARHKLKVPPPLDDAGFARRAYLDLIGLLPAPSELEAFVADDSRDKRADLVHRLLNDQRAYADHWLAFWNDLLRNEYKGTGYIDGGRKQITAWLYKALLDNKGYDQFARELINPTPESEGFAKGIRWRGQVNASQVVELQFAQNVGQVFFGANLKCASCHDSFIDHWKLNDAYGMAAVIADKPMATYRCDKPTGNTAGPKFLFPELGTIDPTLPKAKRLERLAELATHPDNGRFARTIVNRIWHRLMGHGIVHPVDQMEDRPWSDDLLDYLAVYLVDSNYNLKKLMEHIATSAIYQAQAVPVPNEVPPDEYVFRGPELKRLTAEEFVDAVWMLTGTAPAKPVAQAPIPPFPETTPKERRFVRATLVDADLLMRSLGRPNREQVVTTRPDQLSTLQALDLANGRILAETLARGAANVLKANPNATPDEIATRVFVQALCRKPTADELAAARGLIGDKPTADGVADLLWAVVMLPEFQLVR
jgi:mono/diheme cytochrome c family protein